MKKKKNPVFEIFWSRVTLTLTLIFENFFKKFFFLLFADEFFEPFYIHLKIQFFSVSSGLPAFLVARKPNIDDPPLTKQIVLWHVQNHIAHAKSDWTFENDGKRSRTIRRWWRTSSRMGRTTSSRVLIPIFYLFHKNSLPATYL